MTTISTTTITSVIRVIRDIIATSSVNVVPTEEGFRFEVKKNLTHRAAADIMDDLETHLMIADVCACVSVEQVGKTRSRVVGSVIC